jgi:hypothetical protein
VGYISVTRYVPHTARQTAAPLGSLIIPTLFFFFISAELDLEFNDLTGKIPSELGQLTTLSLINLSLNLLTGQMPSELGNLVRVQELTFYRNTLSGTVPESFVHMTSLRKFDISSQVFNTSVTPPQVLTGPLPQDWTTCTSLEQFIVEENFFVGPPPFAFNSVNLSKFEVCFTRWRIRPQI